MNDIVTRATIEEMVAHRNKSIALYRDAFAAVAIADEAMKAARLAANPFQPETPIGYVDSHIEEVARFYNAVKLPDPVEFMKVAEKL